MERNFSILVRELKGFGVNEGHVIEIFDTAEVNCSE